MGLIESDLGLKVFPVMTRRSRKSYRSIRLALVLLTSILPVGAQVQPQALLSKTPVERQRALRALAALSPAEKAAYVPALLELLRGKEPFSAVLPLAKVGPVAIPTLLPLLDDPDDKPRGFAVM